MVCVHCPCILKWTFPSNHEIRLRFNIRMYPASGCATILSATSMSALKRTLASPTNSPRLTSHVSHHNASVTIFQLSAHEDDIEHSPRRSKRVKTRNITDPESQADLDNLTHDVLAVKLRKAGVNATASGSVLPSLTKARDVQASPKKFKAIPQSLATPHPPPSTWKETYDTIKDMRSRFVAPVDTMGCDRAQLKETDPRVINDFPFFLAHSRPHSESTFLFINYCRTADMQPLSLSCCLHKPRMKSQMLPCPNSALPLEAAYQSRV